MNMQLLYDPAVTLLDIYPEEAKTSIHTKTHITMYMAALFVMPKT